MGERAQALAQQFERVNSEAILLIESFSSEQWQMPVADDGWPVGVVCHHVATTLPFLVEWIMSAAQGQDVRVSRETIDSTNARHAQEQATCTRAETLDLLRHNGAAAARAVRELDDGQLDHVATIVTDIPPLTAKQAIEQILIGHMRRHFRNIRSALGMS